MTAEVFARVGDMNAFELRRVVSGLIGLQNRIHAHLHLDGDSPSERHAALVSWCDARRAEKAKRDES